MRFIGGGLAPFVAGLLVTAFNPIVPFLLGTATLIAAAIILSTVHKTLTAGEQRGDGTRLPVGVEDRGTRVSHRN